MQVDATTLGFLEKLNADASLQAELQAALEGTTDRTAAILTVAASKGYAIDRKSFEMARTMLAAAVRDSGTLDESELEAVAGGLNPQPEPPGVMFRFAQTIQPTTWTLILR